MEDTDLKEIKANVKLEYVRIGKSTRKKGVLVAVKDPDMEHVLVGWAMKHTKEKKKKFDKEIGWAIALERAMAWDTTPDRMFKWSHDLKYRFPHSSNLAVPHSIRQQLFKFVQKMKRYFRDQTFSEWTVLFEHLPEFQDQQSAQSNMLETISEDTFIDPLILAKRRPLPDSVSLEPDCI